MNDKNLSEFIDDFIDFCEWDAMEANWCDYTTDFYECPSCGYTKEMNDGGSSSIRSIDHHERCKLKSLYDRALSFENEDSG